jgi:hypothetical protein
MSKNKAPPETAPAQILWGELIPDLQKLKERSQDLLEFILHDVRVQQDGEPVLPKSPQQWLKGFYSGKSKKELEDKIELLSGIVASN